MNPEPRNQIRSHLESLDTVLRHLRDARNQPKPFDTQIGMKPVKELTDLISRIEADLPGVVPPFKSQDYVIFNSLKGQPRFENQKIQDYVQQAVECLKKAQDA